jgi:4-amino-4-deoxy-L-arabinose transferase-like glycosyltransferase
VQLHPPFWRFGRFWLALGVIAVAALALRATYIAVAKYGEPPLGDQVYYNAQANANAAGRWFRDAFDDEPTAEHPPLAALALTPTSWFAQQIDDTTDNVLAHRFTMAVFGVGVVVLLGLLGRVVAGERAGLIAAGLATVYPALWINDGLVMSETIATLAVALVLLLVHRFIATPCVLDAALAGAACGLAAMARQELLMLLPITIVPVLLLARTVDLRRRFVMVGASMLATVILAAPWVMWNLVRFDRPVTFSTNDGLTICGANLHRVYYGSQTGLWALDCLGFDVPEGDRSVRSEALRERGFDFITDHLDRLPVVVMARVARVWSLYAPRQMVDYNQGEGREPWASWLAFAAWWLLVPAAVGGAVALRRRKVALWPLLSQLVIVTITAVAIYGLVRFRIAAEVSVVVLAAVGIDAIVRARAAGDRSSRSGPTRS